MQIVSEREDLSMKHNFFINSQSSNSALLISNSIHQIFNDIYIHGQNIIVLCIGTDRCIGDALGPLVGSKLYKDFKTSNITVFGTLNNPVHAKNITDSIDYIYSSIENPFVIAVDASLGKTHNIGYVNIFNGAINPGIALNKSLPPVGDIGITGVVNTSGSMEYITLQNTRLSVVNNIAEKIYLGIHNFLLTSGNNYPQQKSI